MFKNVMIVLHILWLISWVTILILMLLPSNQAGHPSIIVFSPLAAIAGIVGHVFLAIVQYLRGLSNRIDEKYREGNLSSVWPWQIILALVALSFLSIRAVVSAPVLVMYLFRGQFNIVSIVPVLMIYIISVAALIGLVLRSSWGYRLIQTLCALGMSFPIYLLGVAFYIGNVSTHVLLTMLGTISVFGAFLYLFSISYRVRVFFGITKEVSHAEVQV